MTASWVVAEALTTQNRPVKVLPESWFEPGLPERMADWITRNELADTRT